VRAFSWLSRRSKPEQADGQTCSHDKNERPANARSGASLVETAIVMPGTRAETAQQMTERHVERVSHDNTGAEDEGWTRRVAALHQRLRRSRRDRS
jgi:hypothetical protein